jgi:cysteine desulfurase
LEAAKQIADVTFVAPDRNGLIDPLDIQRAIRTNTRLVSVMHANNELGTIQPIEEIGRIAREQGIAFHSDGIQAVGKVPVNYCPDLYAISAHKFYGPKGSGALIVRKGMEIEARQFGGRHQRRIRPGTENVAGAVGLAAALKYCQPTGDASLRDLLETLVLRDIADAHVNGVNAPRVPNTSNLRFDGIDSEPLLIALDMRGFAISAGSACSSGAAEPSHVLTAIGLSKEQARSSIRISLGKSNTREQVEALAGALAECVAHLRKVAPAYV